MGCLTMVIVAWANDATSCMLIRAAAATGKPTYEELAEWAGGRPWKVKSLHCNLLYAYHVNAYICT